MRESATPSGKALENGLSEANPITRSGVSRDSLSASDTQEQGSCGVILDVRGLSCPEPVLNLKPLLEKGEGEVEVLCSCGAASDNITRLARHYGYEVQKVRESEGEITYHLSKK
ncbi:sulfurtransferase TusA family protein [uncultured Helicobacter sp.]|uniref:sulfurtransferase TusA family protein n=1 Tax=uncultured Helicobacter sp. TaxID=175537 RepID=UPI001C3B6F0F|nr:sulfurtransferase TusA family protein [Candidatus Helicobacter avicola]